MVRNCCVDIFREEICDETILGIPCFIGENIIGLAKFSDSGLFDGYCFIEKMISVEFVMVEMNKMQYLH